MSNGYIRIHGCTITENQVYGVSRVDDLGKPNIAGGVVATIGNAHAVRSMTIGHSVIAGNTVHEFAPPSAGNKLQTGMLMPLRRVAKDHGSMDVD